MRKVLVTGGAGFVGSFLCEKLLETGHHVTCLDNLQTGSVQNVNHLMGQPNFEFVLMDIELPLTGLKGIDQIFNLACPASPVHYQTDPIRTMRTCVLGALNVLDLARHTGARVLQASTSEIYGDPEVHPQHEDYRGNVNAFGPRACYDEGKRAAETLFHDYNRMHNVDIRIARIFNTYGPRMAASDGRVVSNFIIQALRGEAITVYGDGSQTRSFCFVSDLVDGLIALMNAKDMGATPCNLGNPGEFTVRQLAEQVVRMTESASQVEYRDLPVDDPTRRRPDIGLAQSRLGWEPKVPLALGLRQTVAYFQKAGMQDHAPNIRLAS